MQKVQYNLSYKSKELSLFDTIPKNTKPALELCSGAGFIRFKAFYFVSSAPPAGLEPATL
jgi:hypothetical protein